MTSMFDLTGKVALVSGAAQRHDPPLDQRNVVDLLIKLGDIVFLRRNQCLQLRIVDFQSLDLRDDVAIFVDKLIGVVADVIDLTLRLSKEAIGLLLSLQNFFERVGVRRRRQSYDRANQKGRQRRREKS